MDIHFLNYANKYNIDTMLSLFQSPLTQLLAGGVKTLILSSLPRQLNCQIQIRKLTYQYILITSHLSIDKNYFKHTCMYIYVCTFVCEKVDKMV